MSGKRILIFTGGFLEDWALKEIQEDDLIIGVDRGALFLIDHGIVPHHALGDFDSVSMEEFHKLMREIPSITSCDPIHKDLTDTEMAIEWALLKNPKEILVLGALGSRFDHSLANVHLLLKCLHAGVPSRILDLNNEIRLIDQSLQIDKGRFSTISLLPLSMNVTGITLEGFQYPLHEATLTLGESLGISNVLTEPLGTISISSGYLLVIQSKD